MTWARRQSKMIGPPYNIARGMRPEQEARHDAKIAAAAAERPKEVGVFGFAGGDETAVGEDHIGLEQIVEARPYWRER